MSRLAGSVRKVDSGSVCFKETEGGIENGGDRDVCAFYDFSTYFGNDAVLRNRH